MITPDSCPPYLNVPECLPPLGEHDAQVMLVVLVLICGVGMGFMLGRIDWRLLGTLLKGIFRRRFTRINADAISPRRHGDTEKT